MQTSFFGLFIYYYYTSCIRTLYFWKGPFTVFGPTDDAFSKLPKEVLERLQRDKQLLADVLKYHVVSGNVYSSQLSNEMTAPSLLQYDSKDVDIRINIYNGGKVNRAKLNIRRIADNLAFLDKLKSLALKKDNTCSNSLLLMAFVLVFYFWLSLRAQCNI